MAEVDKAAGKADPAAYYAGKVPTRERITAALDMCQMYGPQVDRALGGTGGFICGSGGCRPMGEKQGHTCEHCGRHRT